MTTELTRTGAAVRLALLCAGAAFATSTTAVAQDSAAAADSLVLEEVIVTARKREESMQDVPISITAFSASTIEERGIESVYDIAKLTPNLSFNQAYGRVFDRPVIRGMSQVLGERTVSFVVDGVYIAGNITGADLDDLEAIEVLKGPQATTFGRGSIAGVISYRTKRPTKDWTGKASLSLGDDGWQEASGNISGPIIGDKLTFKLGARYYDYEGQYTGVSSDGRRIPLGAEQTKRVSGAVRWEPTENIDFTLRAFAAQNSDGLYNNTIFRTLNCFNTGPAARGGSFCGDLPPIAQNDGIRLDYADIERLGKPGIYVDTNLYSGELNWDIGPVTATALVSWNRQDDDWIIDDYLANTSANLVSTVPSPTMTVVSPGNAQRLVSIKTYRSQELRFASNTDGPLQWLAGVYHYDQSVTGLNQAAQYNILTAGMANVANTGPVGTLRPYTLGSPTFVDNEAVFASISYDLTDRWHLSLEGRYAKDVLTTNNTNQVVIGANPLGRGTFCNRVLEEEFTSFSPRGTIRFDFTENVNFYVNVSRGTKPGDFNSTLCSVNLALTEAQRLAALAPLGVKEEEALNYELGTKLRLLDGRMSLDAALFFIDWTNQQLTLSQLGFNSVTNTTTNFSLTTNAGETSIKGIELNWRFKATDNWDFNAGYGYTDAEFDRFCDSTFAAILGSTAPQSLVTPCIGASSVATLSVAGFQTANAPKHTANIGAQFDMPINDTWSFFARVDGSFQSKRYAEIYNHASTGDTKRVDMRVGLARDAWRITAWVKNLADERDPDSVVRFFDTDSPTLQRAYQVHYPNGRSFGVTAAVEF